MTTDHSLAPSDAPVKDKNQDTKEKHSQSPREIVLRTLYYRVVAFRISLAFSDRCRPVDYTAKQKASLLKPTSPFVPCQIAAALFFYL